MQSKIRAILKKKEDKYTIYIAVTINGGTPSLISITDKIHPKAWNVKNEQVVNHPLQSELNAKILAAKKDLSDIILNCVIKKKTVTASSVKQLYLSKDLTNIFDFTDRYLTDMASKRDEKTLSIVKRHMKKLEDYNGSRNLVFESITPDYLNAFEKHLFNENLSNNYVRLVFRAVRKIFNAAKKAGITDSYPFGVYEMLTYKSPDKEYPSESDLELIKKFETKNNALLQTKAWFIFGCHSGLRISDWYRFSKDPDSFINKNRLVLHPKKKSTGMVSMPICKDLKQSISVIKLYQLTIAEKTINENIKIIASGVKIKKRFTAHSARNHFAIVQCLNKGISSETAAELMGISLETFVDNYSVVTEEKIDLETKRAWE